MAKLAWRAQYVIPQHAKESEPNWDWNSAIYNSNLICVRIFWFLIRRPLPKTRRPPLYRPWTKVSQCERNKNTFFPLISKLVFFVWKCLKKYREKERLLKHVTSPKDWDTNDLQKKRKSRIESGFVNETNRTRSLWPGKKAFSQADRQTKHVRETRS